MFIIQSIKPEATRVQIAGREDIGVVIDKTLVIDGEKTYEVYTADFGFYKISAPASTFRLVSDL